MTRVLFVNGGILGLGVFDRFLAEMLPRQGALDGRRIVLTEDLSTTDRIIRRILCQRVWRDGLFGIRNLDLARFRQELHAGILARRRLAAAGARRFDVLHFHRQATAYGSLDLMAAVPSVVSIDCTQACVLEQSSTSLERASYEPNIRLDGAIFRRAAAIVSTSHWAAQALRAEYPDCRTPIHVLSNPVLLDHFDIGWQGVRRLREGGGALPQFLFVGGDFPRKGGAELLAAWRAGGLHRNARLEIVTDWPIEGPLPAGVTVTRGVRVHSQAWRDCWARADVFVMPTRNEAFGLVYQEAAAAGLPAIGTDHNAVPEIVRHGETGLLVPVGDAEALAGAMQRLAASPALRQEMGGRARRLVEETASPAGYMERLTAVLREAAERKGS